MLNANQYCRLSESQKKYEDLVVEHMEMRNKKDREIEGLRIKWEESQARTVKVEAEYVLYTGFACVMVCDMFDGCILRLAPFLVLLYI